ncbi:MAG: hypothetical protein LT067_06960 [Sulfurovum sp.]|nr:hypothetical protein [Sulfurovum sp.]
MFSQKGLSLDQAPPISVVFRFFLQGALFGIVGGVLLAIYQNEVFDPASKGALVLTHVFTLGIMLSVMLAALFQMLPVIAGVKLTSPIKKANWVQYPLVVGIITLLFAFHFGKISWLYLLASVLLGGSILFIAFIMIEKLLRLSNHSSSSKGITAALFSLVLLVLAALYLTTVLGGYNEGVHYVEIKTAHYSFGLFGWIAVLIISISFQVIEMFYVTPPYPNIMGKYLSGGILFLLAIASIVSFFLPDIWAVCHLVLALLLVAYALLALKRLSQRKRPISDATVWFWRLGLGSLIVSMLCFMLGLFVQTAWVHTLAYLWFGAFALSIVFAMFYKIVPFLTWFHLSSQGYFTAPMMHEIIHPKTAKKHFWIHCSMMAALIMSLIVPQFILLASLLTILSFGWMGYQIVHAHYLYVKTQKEGQKFNY